LGIKDIGFEMILDYLSVLRLHRFPGGDI
jgi:hypothetical protein